MAEEDGGRRREKEGGGRRTRRREARRREQEKEEEQEEEEEGEALLGEHFMSYFHGYDSWGDFQLAAADKPMLLVKCKAPLSSSSAADASGTPAPRFPSRLLPGRGFGARDFFWLCLDGFLFPLLPFSPAPPLPPFTPIPVVGSRGPKWESACMETRANVCPTRLRERSLRK